MNTAKLLPTTSMTRDAAHTSCTVCPGGYQKWTHVFAKVVEGPLAGATLCPECLAALDRGEFDARLLDMADEYTTHAEQFAKLAGLARASVGQPFTAPSYDEWKSADDAADQQYVEEQQSSPSAATVNDAPLTF